MSSAGAHDANIRVEADPLGSAASYIITLNKNYFRKQWSNRSEIFQNVRYLDT